ncbi:MULTISPECIES: type II toxin-antitoxin system RelE/ParE family toxin [Alteromonadaceae]|uniref:type II toxin-antitoxin system RelE/ParE family toxin n=1 Tax=Alteromonadaceae TaxID=72275 RepID=UPI00310720A8
MPEFWLSPKAEQDLESIWVYSFEHWGLVKADQYIDSLFSAFNELANSSKLAISCDHIRVGYRFCREGKHVIYFKITDYGITITRILHERMLPSIHL